MNIYYSPEKFGLTIFGSLEKGGAYEFDTFVVFANADGDLFYATDSGCSCPTPFEDTGVGDLSPIDDETWGAFANDLDAWVAGYGGDRLVTTEVVGLKRKVNRRLKRQEARRA
jgi:hypothetical protein